MNQIIERIAKLPDAQKALVAIVLYAALYAAFYFGIYTGRTDRLGQLKTEHGNLTEERDDVQAKAEHREKFEKEVAALNERLRLALKELPNEREIPELLRRISSIGKKIGLEFLLFQPLPEVPREFYADVPVKLKIEGSFHEVATFLDRIGKLNRIVNVRDITMGSPIERSGKIVLTVDGTAVTYRFLTDEERAPQSTRGRR